MKKTKTMPKKIAIQEDVTNDVEKKPIQLTHYYRANGKVYKQTYSLDENGNTLFHPRMEMHAMKFVSDEYLQESNQKEWTDLINSLRSRSIVTGKQIGRAHV